jgi:hypothetical protein
MEGDRAITDINKCGGRFGGLLFLTLCPSSKNRPQSSCRSPSFRTPLVLAEHDTQLRFSNVGESEEEAHRMGLCEGIVVGLSFMGQPHGICVPVGTTAQQATSIVVQYIDGQPARIHEDFNRVAVEALRANWPCSLVPGARDPLAVVPH